MPSADLIDAGRAKLYCVDSADAHTWSDRSTPIEERARRHDAYENWVRSTVASWIAHDCDGVLEVATLGCSLGAYHAVNIALRHAHVFPFAMGFSGNYDPTTWHAWGDRGDATYFNNPMSYVPNLEGGHLDWLRERVSLLLVVGQGAWEVDPTGALPSTLALADLLIAAREFGTSWTYGATTSRTTGRPGGRSSNTTCRGSVRGKQCPST